MNAAKAVRPIGNMPRITVAAENTMGGISIFFSTSHFSPASKSRPGKKAADTMGSR